MTWTKNFKDLFNLFLQSNCTLCQRPTSQEFCQNCAKQVQKCQISNPCCLWQNPLPVFAWGAYGGMLKRAIAVMKYDNQPQIARPLGQWLAQAWLLHSPIRDHLASPDPPVLLRTNHSNPHLGDRKLVVVPIPLHPSKQKQRGYNQAALIAQSFCEITGLQLKLNGLERIRVTEAQHSLSAFEREKNLAEAFGLGQDFCRRSDATVLLVDDIYTTGATASSAMQTLRQAGIAVYGLAAVAGGVKNS